MPEIGYALADDGEVFLCIEDEPKTWNKLGVVVVDGDRLSIASDEAPIAEDVPVMRALGKRLVAQGRVSVATVAEDGTTSINEAKVFAADA